VKKKFIVGNWKMFGSLVEIKIFLSSVIATLPKLSFSNLALVLCPPAIYLPEFYNGLRNSPIILGAQNLHFAANGPYTGEISASMLLDYCCQYVLVGHSERRILFKDDEKIVAKKFHYAHECGIMPVLCIGETLDEREQGLTLEVLERQLSAVFLHNDFKLPANIIIAYEPVWAIGTGKAATIDVVKYVHEFIYVWIDKHLSPQNIYVLYGGSLNFINAQEILSLPYVDGGLIGKASLDAKQFCEIAELAAHI
jgi:triosephosphate isomerase (TIM)